MHNNIMIIICCNMNSLPQVPLGLASAASVRVGSALGAGNIEQAKLSSKVSVICAGMNSHCT